MFARIVLDLAIVWAYNYRVASPSALPYVDRLVPGGIEAFIADGRAKRQSFETIARRLAIEHQIDVTGQTLASWKRNLEAAS